MSELVTLGGVRLGSDPAVMEPAAEKSWCIRPSGEVLDSMGPTGRSLITSELASVAVCHSPGQVKGAGRWCPMPTGWSKGMAMALFEDV